MKTMLLTPNSSMKSSTTFNNTNYPETRDSYYYPECRKDANCTCTICIDSINATLDLVQQSRRNSRTFSSRPVVPNSPVSFCRSTSDIPTPKPVKPIRPVENSPPIKSTARSNFQVEKAEKRNARSLRCGFFVKRVFLTLIMIFCLEYGVSSLISGVFNARLSVNGMGNLIEKSWGFKDLQSRFVFLENELGRLVGKKIPSCSSADSVWKINQGVLLNSRCVLYKSMTEEVSIWGWPVQSAGLLTTDCSARSLGVISGRVTEWSNGEARYLIRKANSSWIQEKWSSSAVQLNPNTWILEYKQSILMENSRMVSAALEFIKFRLSQEFERMKLDFFLPSHVLFGNRNPDFTQGTTLAPT